MRNQCPDLSRSARHLSYFITVCYNIYLILPTTVPTKLAAFSAFFVFIGLIHIYVRYTLECGHQLPRAKESALSQ